MRLVMVGVDGSPRAAAASQWAARLALSTGGELVAAYAWDSGQAEATGTDLARRRAQAQATLETVWCEPARAAGATPQPMFLDGPPDLLLRAADDGQADLLVVGNRGAGGFASLHLGSVAHHLARHTTRPLAIVPESTAARRPDTIVVGVDGSPGSTAAIAWCARVAPALGARVAAVFAFEPFLEWVPDDDPRSWRRAAEWEVASWVEPLRDVGTSVDVVVIEGRHPVAAIADTARERAAQLIIVGTHGLGGFTKMRLGGVALQLIHHAGLPVVLVPKAPDQS